MLQMSYNLCSTPVARTEIADPFKNTIAISPITFSFDPANETEREVLCDNKEAGLTLLLPDNENEQKNEPKKLSNSNSEKEESADEEDVDSITSENEEAGKTAIHKYRGMVNSIQSYYSWSRDLNILVTSAASPAFLYT